MELALLARVLWRRRLFVIPGLLLAFAAAYSMHGAKPTSIAVAWTRVVVDSQQSQVVDSNPAGVGSLVWRASLLAHLMATPELQRELAARMGLPPDQVAVVDPKLAQPQIPASVPQKASQADATVYAPYVLTPSIPNDSLSMIGLEAAAPDLAGAKRLAAAGVAVLAAHGSPGGTYTSLVYTNDSNRIEAFTVDQVAPIRTHLLLSSKGSVQAIFVSLFLLLGWCAGVAALPRLLRGRLIRRRPQPA